MRIVDMNDLRIGVTLLSFVIFGGIVKWAWSRRNKARFDEAQQLPFLDEPAPPPAGSPAGTREETRHE